MTASVVMLDRRGAAPDAGWMARLDAARRRTRFVRSLKTFLVLAMLLLTGAVVSFIVMSTIDPPPAIDASEVAGQVNMTNPRFMGRDADGRPYVVSAQAARRPDVAASIAATTELASPRLEFTAEDSASATVEAMRGVFDEVGRTLDLMDGVSFFTDSGYRFESEQARVYVDDGRVVGERMIMGEGPLGSIRARSFEIRNGGDSVLFNGEVIARLYPDEEPAAVEETAPALAAAEGEGEGEGEETVGEEPAAVEPPPGPGAHLSRQGGPIDIKADSTEFVSSENLNRWTGSVEVSQGDSTLKADVMSVYFAAQSGAGARQIDRIEVDGSVVYSTPLEMARGDHGIYLASTDQITLTGDVTLIRGDSALSGAQLLIEPREGRSSLSREAPGADVSGGRVRGTLGSAPAASDPQTTP